MSSLVLPTWPAVGRCSSPATNHQCAASSDSACCPALWALRLQAARVAPAFVAPAVAWLAHRLLGWLQRMLDRRGAARAKQLEGKLRKQVRGAGNRQHALARSRFWDCWGCWGSATRTRHQADVCADR